MSDASKLKIQEKMLFKIQIYMCILFISANRVMWPTLSAVKVYTTLAKCLATCLVFYVAVCILAALGNIVYLASAQ